MNANGSEVGRSRALRPIATGARVGWLLLSLTLVLAIGGCDDNITRGIGVENRTQVDLHFRLVKPDGTLWDLIGSAQARDGNLLVLRPGDTALLRDGCTVGDLIALDPAGHEVARRPPPLCIDQRWTITDPPSAT